MNAMNRVSKQTACQTDYPATVWGCIPCANQKLAQQIRCAEHLRKECERVLNFLTEFKLSTCGVQFPPEKIVNKPASDPQIYELEEPTP